MRAANRSGSEGLESDGEEARRLLDSAGKRAKKLMRRAGRTEYESDEDPDERNPYASEVRWFLFSRSEYCCEGSVQEERQSSEDDLSSPKSAQNKKSPSKHRSKLPHGSRRSSGQGSARPSLPNSRAGSPAPPAGTGSAMLAKRATSPRHSRAGSPSTPGSSSKRKDRGESEQPGTPGDSSKRVKVEGDRKLTDADIVAFLKRQPGCVAKTVEVRLRLPCISVT